MMLASIFSNMNNSHKFYDLITFIIGSVLFKISTPLKVDLASYCFFFEVTFVELALNSIEL